MQKQVLQTRENNLGRLAKGVSGLDKLLPTAQTKQTRLSLQKKNHLKEPLR
jgi:hypothetical protein